MALTKDHLITSIHTRLNLSKNKSADLVESLLEIMKSTLASDEDIMISGFGKFCVLDKKKRRGRNPQTGRKLMIDARRVVVFRCSGRVKDRINGKR